MPSSKLLARDSRPSATGAFRAPALMGVLNVTPDSFYPGSRTAGIDDAAARALRMAEEGASLIDVGGQSTRPGSDPVGVEEEIARVIPVIALLRRRLPSAVALSVDTDKAEVVRRALDAGASVVNDVSALRGDPDMARVAVKADRVILMHRLGDSSKSMQDNPRYVDVAAEIVSFLRGRIRAFEAAGGDARRVLVDPGIGFGKTLAHNLSLIKRIGEFATLAPVVLGVSRKSLFSGLRPDAGPQDRLAGSLAVAAWACFSGVSILRVHDVLETRKVLETLAAVAEAA